jgi:hypothetical protein
VRADFNKWWLLPFGILTTLGLIALSIMVSEPSVIGRLSAEVAQRPASESAGAEEAAGEPSEKTSEAVAVSETSEGAATDCSDASTTDYVCYQKRYQALVHDYDVEAAFAELKDEYTTNKFVRSNCHQLTHVIGRAAGELYGGISGAYGRGDPFCTGGYYHGVMEAVVAEVGADKILNEANMLCADLRVQRYSDYHFNCVHGLGHGFMGILENELFESLRTCDVLVDGWERENCYGGVFMENLRAKDNPSHTSEYLKADQPLYPCTDVETKYKNLCYQMQTSYALEAQDNDFAKVFALCATYENNLRPACYQGLGHDAAWQSIGQNIPDVAEPGFTSMMCMLGGGFEARSNCVVGAIKYFTDHYRSDAQARALCGFFDPSLRVVCFGGGGGTSERRGAIPPKADQSVPIPPPAQREAVVPKGMDQPLDQGPNRRFDQGYNQRVEQAPSQHFEQAPSQRLDQAPYGGYYAEPAPVQNLEEGVDYYDAGDVFFDEAYEELE